MDSKTIKNWRRPVKVPTVIQMEAVECGAASLAMILSYHGCQVPLEKLREDCGVSRDGSTAVNILKAAREYGLTSSGLRLEPEQFNIVSGPAILWWNFNHFVVLCGAKRGKIYINDPASGPRLVSVDEFNESFSGIVLTFSPGKSFERRKYSQRFLPSLMKRFQGVKSGLAAIFLASLLLVVPGLILPFFMKIFINDVLIDRFHGWLRPLVLGMAITLIVDLILTWLQQYYLLKTRIKLSLSMSYSYIMHLFRLPVMFFLQRSAGELENRVGYNDTVAALLGGQLATNALNALMVVFYGLMMFLYSPKLTLMSIASVIISLALLKYMSNLRITLNQSLYQERGKLVGKSMIGLRLIETLKATGSESDFFSIWAGHQTRTTNFSQRMQLSSIILDSLTNLVRLLNSNLVLIFGALFVMEGKLSVGSLVAFQYLLRKFIAPIDGLVQLGSSFQEAHADINRLDDVLRYPADVPAESLLETYNEDLEKQQLDGYVTLKDISFGYSRRSAPLIENFELTLSPGRRIALVGGSGSGKSTIAKLIAGIYKPWEGEILFDHKPRESWPRYVVTDSLAYVEQESSMFSGTIMDNLSLWDETIEMGVAVSAAKDALIHEDIAARSGAYLGEVEEAGGNFSGGQCQRMEIARALLKNPSILILDEATSALDAATEQKIDANIRKRGCACLIVAHRLSTIRDADEIIVMDKGKVVQRGTHEQLLAAKGAYAELFQLGEHAPVEEDHDS